MGPPELASQTIAEVLWWRGIRHLDAVVLSHADVDHYNALPGLVERFSIETLYVAPALFRRSAPALAPLRQSLAEARIEVRHCAAGDELLDDLLAAASGQSPAERVRLLVLHPPPVGVSGTDNANSIVLQIDYAGRRVLLPGDLEQNGLDLLLAHPPLDCDLAMGPHHGSLGSEPQRFVSWSRPEVLVISGAHPEHLDAFQALLPPGGRVLHTARDGAVTVSLGKTAIEVETWLSPTRAAPLYTESAAE